MSTFFAVRVFLGALPVTTLAMPGVSCVLEDRDLFQCMIHVVRCLRSRGSILSILDDADELARGVSYKSEWLPRLGCSPLSGVAPL